jgi:hypothetical protein
MQKDVVYAQDAHLSRCVVTFNSVLEGGISETGLASGTETFMRIVRASEAGKTLADCPEISYAAWGEILLAMAQVTNEGASFRVNERTGVLLTVYAYMGKLNKDQLDILKSFIKSRPWQHGFNPFTSSIAVDALLAQMNDPNRNNTYHTYTQEEMESALQKYAK